jgi:putative oxidoreductase
MVMEWLALIGRGLFGLYFVLAGINHFAKYSGLKEYASFKKIPAAGVAVIITGLVLLGGGLSILTGYLIQTALILLAIFLIVAAFTVHNYWTVDDENAKAGEQSQFLKNIAIASASLLLLQIGTWTWTL